MHRNRLAAGLICVFLATLLARTAGAGGVGAAPLRVEEGRGLQRKSWPVTIGVPLPKGWAGSGQSVRVVGPKGGAAMPTQSRALAYWPGTKSLRWLLVDFQTDLDPRQHREFSLQVGPPPAPKSAVAVQQRGADVEIDTGALRVAAGKGSGGLFRLKALHGQPLQSDPVHAEMVVAGRVSAAGPPDEIRIEDRGPLRAAIVLRGTYGNGFTYEVRLQAFAGQPFVRVQHTFINGNGEPTSRLERLSVHVPARSGVERTWSALLDGGQKLAGEVRAQGVVLAQIDSASLQRDGQPQAGKLAGWFELQGGALSLGLDAPFFWQEYPQTVELLPHGLRYDLFAGGERAAAIGVGAAKTHEFDIVFGKGGDLIPQPGRGVTAFAAPTWTAGTGALLNAVDPVRERAFVGAASAAFDRTLASIDAEVWDEAGACTDLRQEVRRTGTYGMLNWGDWNFRGYHDTTKGCDAWGNQEYDLTQVLALLFAATGRAEVWQFLVAAARHYGEVDVIHHLPRHPEWVGMNHPKNPLHFSFEHGGVDLGHTWVEGLFSYYFLTGEPRARDAAIGIADYLLRRLRQAVKGNPRQFGWPALALAAAYEATGNEQYRTAALDYARIGIRMHPVPEKIDRNWKLGILADAVSYVHAISPDAALRSWLVAYAAAVTKSQAKDIRYFPAVAYVGHLTQAAAMKEAARSAAGRIVFGDWAKPFTIGGRCGFRILSQVDATP